MKWSASVTLTQDYTWKGEKDLFFIYSNPDAHPLEPNCSTATTLPGQYKAGDKLYVEQTCYSFKTTAKKGAKVSFWFFDWNERFPDELIFEFPIPGITGQADIIPNLISDEEQSS